MNTFDEAMRRIKATKAAELAVPVATMPSPAVTTVSPDQLDPLAKKALALLLAVPGRRYAVAAEPLADGRTRIGYARQLDDGPIVTAIIEAVIDPMKALRLVMGLP